MESNIRLDDLIIYLRGSADIRPQLETNPYIITISMGLQLN